MLRELAAYMKVVTEVANLEAEQEFFSDVASVGYTSLKSMVLRWPGHMQLIHKLKSVCYSSTVHHGVLRRHFPTWRMRGISR